MNQERLLWIDVFYRLPDAAASVEQQIAFVADYDFFTITGMPSDMFDDHICMVMYIDHDSVESMANEIIGHSVEHRDSVYLDQGFRTSVGDRLQSCAESGGEYHGLSDHVVDGSMVLSIPCSMC